MLLESDDKSPTEAIHAIRLQALSSEPSSAQPIRMRVHFASSSGMLLYRDASFPVLEQHNAEALLSFPPYQSQGYRLPSALQAHFEQAMAASGEQERLLLALKSSVGMSVT